MLNKTSGILFLDEISNVSRPDVKSVTYKLLLDRKAGYIKFHRDVLVVAAGNSTEHSAIAEGFTTPQANRMIIIHLKQPTVDAWARWNDHKYGDEWDRRCYAFLKAFESDNYLLQLPKEPLVEQNFPTPRSWSTLAVLLKKGINRREVIEGLVGPEVGNKLQAFLKLHINVSELIKHPMKWGELKVDAKYMATLMLANWISKNHSKANEVFRLIDFMAGDSHEYLVFLLKVMRKTVRTNFLQKLISYNKKYQDILSDIVLELAGKIRR